MASRGWVAVQAGVGIRAVSRRPFTYYEHPSATGIIVEVVKPPTERFPPEWTYPAPAEG